MKKLILLVVVMTFQIDAVYADKGGNYYSSKYYPDFYYSKICHGYTVAEGFITKVVSTTQNDGEEAVYIEMIDRKKNKHGGMIYPRAPTAYGYTPLERSAYIALITQVKVKGCFNKGDVYSLELSN